MHSSIGSNLNKSNCAGERGDNVVYCTGTLPINSVNILQGGRYLVQLPNQIKNRNRCDVQVPPETFNSLIMNTASSDATIPPWPSIGMIEHVF